MVWKAVLMVFGVSFFLICSECQINLYRENFFFFFPNRLFAEMLNNTLRKNSTLVILRGQADLQLHPPSAAVDPHLA